MTVKIDREVFFARVKPLFGGKLRQGVVDNLSAILDAMEKYKIQQTTHAAYILATAYGESYSKTKNPDLNPVREGFTKTDEGARQAVAKLKAKGKISTDYSLPTGPAHQSYYGRGYVQITWLFNYVKFMEALNVDLVGNPDLALQRKVAAEILVLGMRDGLFTGRALRDFAEYKPMRKIINGTDRASQFAEYAKTFAGCITWQAIDDSVTALPLPAPVPVIVAKPHPKPIDVAAPPAYTPSVWERVKAFFFVN